MKLLILLTLALVSVGVSTPVDNRPWNLFVVHYITEDGDRKFQQYEVRNMGEALARFSSENPTDMVTCVASRYYNYCEEQNWQFRR
jgi:hypothetical protein